MLWSSEVLIDGLIFDSYTFRAKWLFCVNFISKLSDKLSFSKDFPFSFWLPSFCRAFIVNDQQVLLKVMVSCRQEEKGLIHILNFKASVKKVFLSFHFFFFNFLSLGIITVSHSFLNMLLIYNFHPFPVAIISLFLPI